MGVRFVDGNNQPTGEYGLVVTSVYPDSPASEAGFRRGTFFAQYNGAAITAANLNSVYGTLIAPGGASTVKLTENKQGAQPGIAHSTRNIPQSGNPQRSNHLRCA